jgi:excinuclease ABC subunit C
VKELSSFLEGRRDALVRSLSKRMKAHSAAREYEKARSLYEAIKALSTVPSTGRRQKTPLETLEDFRGVFSLPTIPRRIECFDISNLQGREAVGSAVVFIDGEPSRKDYRHFRIRTVQGIDDYRMMQEVVRRRYERALSEGLGMPDLILIDGGKGHLSAVKDLLSRIGLPEQPVLSIAKQHEIVFSPERPAPYVLPPSSETLQMIRHLRDEAHRFAISYHRRLRRKAALISGLDGIPGLGPKSKQKLLKNMGSFAKIRKASEDELIRIGRLPAALAAAVRRRLQTQP